MLRLTLSLGLFFLLLVIAPYAYANSTTYYVSTAGNDNSTCGSQPGQQACASLNYILKNKVTTDGGIVLVEPGTYNLTTTININKKYVNPLLIQSIEPYKAILVGEQRVLYISKASNVTVKDFEITHSPLAACTNASNPLYEKKRYVIQISDNDGYGGPSQWYYDANLNYIPLTDDYTYNITLENNIIHDSYCDDLIKLNRVGNITIKNNILYNQGGFLKDEHIDANSVFNVSIDGNIFFNDYSGSGRNLIHSGPAIVIKDSSNGVPIQNVEGYNDINGNIFAQHPGTFSSTINNSNDQTACDPKFSNCDSITGSNNVSVTRNIFMNWESLDLNGAFVTIGQEDSENYIALNTLIENNLILGNNKTLIRTPFEIKNAYNTTIRHNTISGDMPTRLYGLRTRLNINANYTKFPNNIMHLYNNIWADNTGTMGSRLPGDTSYPKFAEVTAQTITNGIIDNNLFWNAGNSIPQSGNVIDSNMDTHKLIADPSIINPDTYTLPIYRWNGTSFGGLFNTIPQVFEEIVSKYAALALNSPAINKGRQSSITVDILNRPRTSADLGAFEVIVTPTPTPTPTPTSTNAFTATYYNNKDFTAQKHQVTEQQINHNWGKSAPYSNMGINHFSVRWLGEFDFLTTKDYTFTTNSDDGVRLYIDGNLVINDWNNHAAKQNTVTVPITQGAHTVKLEYFENKGNALVSLYWE